MYKTAGFAAQPATCQLHPPSTLAITGHNAADDCVAVADVIKVRLQLQRMALPDGTKPPGLVSSPAPRSPSLLLAWCSNSNAALPCTALHSTCHSSFTKHGFLCSCRCAWEPTWS